MTTINLNRATPKTYKNLCFELIKNILEGCYYQQIQDAYMSLNYLNYFDLMEISERLSNTSVIKIDIDQKILMNITEDYISEKVFLLDLLKYNASISQMRRWFGLQPHYISKLRKMYRISESVGRSALILDMELLDEVYTNYKQLDNSLPINTENREANIYLSLAKKFNLSIKSLEKSLNVY